MSQTDSRWVVLKFGGTSVATATRWETIARLVEQRIAEGFRPLVVCSALAGISNRLEAMLERAVAGDYEATRDEIRRRHLELGAELGLPAEALLQADLEELSRLALAAALLRDAGPALKARVMALGELLSTRLGAAFLQTQGIATAWLDARTALLARDEPHARAARAYLSASCEAELDPTLVARLAALPEAAVLTQGFIAGNPAGETVLLGRGGSDTSAAYFAAKLGAVRCEIWTDVPGMFTANPALLPSARLLRALDYEEAQEIATTGAKVLHPRSIPPLKRHQIPLHVLSTDRPDAPGTVISAAGSDGDPQVKAISSRRGLTLISMETVGMWQEVGFLAEVFACFARHGLSIDAVSTSQTNVTVSLDPNAQAIEPAVIRDLLRDLASHCEPRVIAPTASISLVGPGIRGILHELGHLLELFAELSIYLVTQSASDLNLTFFVDEEQSERLVRQLHGRLFGQRTESAFLGPTWSELYGAAAAAASPPEWWQRRREELLDVAAKEAPVYVYDEATLEEAAKALLNLPAVDRVFYSLKANSHPGVLAVFHRLGLSFECVSVPEIEHLLALFPDLDAGDHQQLLFTPNFASREELAQGFALGARVTIDSLYPIVAWPELLAGREIFLRLDPGRGRGHHPYVRTAGVQSKFGLSLDQLLEAAERLARAGARVVGLHAHAGSGIQTPEAWGELAVFLGTAAERFPEVRVLDVGGGLGVPERHGQSPLDLAALDAGLARFKAAYAVHPPKELWLEPGRFLVAPAGVLLARVTQVKRKGEVQYVGVETGMNSLIRPALYGAYHTIVNLTRLHEPATQVAHVVGPICETGDVLGRSRRLAPAAEGDVLLIANAGAYGRVMSSRYNLREPAGERLLGRAAQ
ncbi:MAG TPA: bifunctional aspartate kinase/diaminopimelate decarboxylase [Thermoanaerobaculia bacterium]|nr:bifunctional aspartate kinase/diaminopimelate decarboxylase [Thermoanaerobaculia bacterium]